MLFDLDNTLYDEGEYFAAVFPAAGELLAWAAGVSAAEVARRLERIQREKGRHYGKLFDDLLGELGLGREHLRPLLDAYCSVRPRLRPFPGARELLRGLRGRAKLGLVTSGLPAAQANKLELLGLRGAFDAVVFSSTLPENKPSALPFRRALEALGAAPERAAYVGDSPLFDFKGANELGMLTVRVRNPAFDGLAVPAGWDARVRVESVADLSRLPFLQEENVHAKRE